MVPNRAALAMDLEVERRRVKCVNLNDNKFDKSPMMSNSCSTTQARPEEPGDTELEIIEIAPPTMQANGPLSPRLLTLFHVIIVLYYIAVNYEMFICSRKLRDTGHPVTKMFLCGITQFFTDWTQVIHQTYFALSLIQDLLGFLEHPQHIKTREAIASFRRKIFGPVLLPATCLTAANFWICFTVAPHLMLDDLVVLYPRIMNHAMHTFIIPIAYAELLASPHKVVPRWQGLRSVTALMSIYASWMYTISYVTGYWPYRFLEVMNIRQHIIFIPSMHAFGYMWFFMNEAIIKLVWGDPSKKNKRKKDKDTQE